MSPLKGILVCPQHEAQATARRGAAACAAFLIALTLACRTAVASELAARELSDADARHAEKVLAKLRLLHEAAGDGEAYRSLASKFYPDLFVKVAGIRPGDLRTDLSTAVFLAEKLARNWAAAGGETADCRGERPDIYMPLCLNLRGGTARQLLLAKSRLHARWAEAVLRNDRGDAGEETARALSEMRDARAFDLLIAARVLEELRPLGGMPRRSDAERRGRYGSSAVAAEEPEAEFEQALRKAGALLAWMPRGATFNHLSNARRAYADGLWWRDKARRSQSLVISAKGFAPDPLKDLRLDAAQVSAVGSANWRSASRHALLAEQTLSLPAASGLK